MSDGVDQLEQKRRDYARRITALTGIDRECGIGRDIMAAFAAVPREKFAGPPPWTIISPEGQIHDRSGDPADLYQDVLIALSAAKGLNNGQPSLHAFCLKALAPKKGERAIHVGAGTGYYTAIMAKLVGETGQVDAYEIEPDLAHRAQANLAGLSQVLTHARSGAEAPLPDSDVIYVSAACAEPLGIWLDALCPGGRLLFPMAAEGEAGRMLLVTRESEQVFQARFLCAVQFVACIGAQDQEAARNLEMAFQRGGWDAVKSLRRNNQPDERCWCVGRGWWLSTR